MPLFNAIGVNLESIDIKAEKQKLISNIAAQVLGIPMLTGLLFLLFYFYSKISHETFDPSNFYPIAIILVIVMTFCVTGSLLRYLILKFRTRARH